MKNEEIRSECLPTVRLQSIDPLENFYIDEYMCDVNVKVKVINKN